MDADFDPTRDYKAEKRRAKKFGKGLAKKLPLFDPSEYHAIYFIKINFYSSGPMQ